MPEVFDLTLLDSNNDDAVPDGAPEGWAPSSANNVLRALMGKLRRWYDDPEYLDVFRDAVGDKYTLVRDSDTELTVQGADVRVPYLPVGRRCQIVGDSTKFGRVESTVFAGGDTTITFKIDAPGTLPVSPVTLLVNIMASLDSDNFAAVGDPIAIGEFL